MRSRCSNRGWRWVYEGLESQKKKIQIELGKNLKSHLSDNVVTGQIFMAIENIHSKCLEIDNSIKQVKIGKKPEGRTEGEAREIGGDKGAVKVMVKRGMAKETLQKGSTATLGIKKAIRQGDSMAEEGNSRTKGLREKVSNSRRGKSATRRTAKEAADGKDVGEDGDMLSLALANEKLKYVLNSLMDFREILRRERQHKA